MKSAKLSYTVKTQYFPSKKWLNEISCYFSRGSKCIFLALQFYNWMNRTYGANFSRMCEKDRTSWLILLSALISFSHFLVICTKEYFILLFFLLLISIYIHQSSVCHPLCTPTPLVRLRWNFAWSFKFVVCNENF